PVRAIKEALLEGVPEESRALVWSRLGEGAPWQEAEEALRMPSFSGEKRCVYWEDPDLPGEALLRYLDQPGPGVLVLRFPGGVDGRLSWVKKVKAKGYLVEAAPPGGRQGGDQVAAWVVRQAEKHGILFSPAVGRWWVEQIGTDLDLLDQELEKLSLFYGEGQRVQQKDLVPFLPPGEAQVFSLADLLGQRQGKEALATAAKLLNQGEEPLRLLALLQSHFRLMLAIMEMPPMSPSSLAERLGQHPFRVQKIQSQGKRFTRQQVKGMLLHLLEAEAAIKTGKQMPQAALWQALAQAAGT
ncbi:MAG: DNA polymerase III subunit delta, partial [Bacillota bacterium]|nr:DNA polymerase III subunit delta [Bacillota bacterium]